MIVRYIITSIITALLLVLLVSCRCERSNEGSLVNQFGGQGRTNSYEGINSFYKQLAITDKPAGMQHQGGTIAAPLLLSSSEFCFASSSGSILLTTKGSKLWEYKIGGNQAVASNMCADREQNIYAITSNGELISLNRKGELRWRYSFDTIPGKLTIFSDLLAVDDGIVMASSNGKLAKLDFSGRLMWEMQFALSPTETFSADKDGNIAVILTNNEFSATDSLIVLNKSGAVVWGKAFPETRLIKYPAISDGRIYIAGLFEKGGQRISQIICLSKHDGRNVWVKELAFAPRFISVADNGDVIITGYNSGIGDAISGIFCLDSSSSLKWKIYFDYQVPTPILISKEDIAVVGRSPKAWGVFFLDRNGTVQRTVSLSESPLIYPMPSVTPDGVIVFGGADGMEIIRIDDTPLNKILPY